MSAATAERLEAVRDEVARPTEGEAERRREAVGREAVGREAVGRGRPARRPAAVAAEGTGGEPGRAALGARSRALVGPIAAAVTPFAAADALPGLADPAAVLAGLIDLRGGVVLAERLAELDGPLPAAPASDPAAVRATLHAGLADLEGRLDEAFTQAFRPRYRLPSAQRAWLIIERSGLLDAPKTRGRKPPRELRIAVRHLWAPFAEFLDTHLKRARFALRDLRVELGPQITGLSVDAARLAQLDAALGEATHGTSEKLYRRVALAAEQAFTEGLVAAWRALPAEGGAAAFAVGWTPEGWLGDRLAAAQALYRAVVHHERARIEALVEAACGLALR